MNLDQKGYEAKREKYLKEKAEFQAKIAPGHY